jgi:hypothetical protein
MRSVQPAYDRRLLASMTRETEHFDLDLELVLPSRCSLNVERIEWTCVIVHLKKHFIGLCYQAIKARAVSNIVDIGLPEDPGKGTSSSIVRIFMGVHEYWKWIATSMQPLVYK